MLEQQGTLISSLDTLITAHVLSLREQPLETPSTPPSPENSQSESEPRLERRQKIKLLHPNIG